MEAGYKHGNALVALSDHHGTFRSISVSHNLSRMGSISALAKAEGSSTGVGGDNLRQKQVKPLLPRSCKEACYRYGNTLITLSDHHSNFGTVSGC